MIRLRVALLALAAIVSAAPAVRAAGTQPWLFDEDASNHPLFNLHHLTLNLTAEPNPVAGKASCWLDLVGATWTCRNPSGVASHGVQTSLPGGNFVIGIGPDGYVYRGGVSANQVFGLWPVAITGNGSDLNPLSTPLDRLAQSGATPGQLAAWNGTAWAPASPASSGADALGYYVVTQASHAPANAFNLGGLAASGLLKCSYSTGVCTPALAVAQASGATTGGADYQGPGAYLTGLGGAGSAGTATGPGLAPLTLNLAAGALVTGLLPLTNQAAPTGTGFAPVTSGVWGAAARAVDVSSADITSVLKATAFPALTGPVTTVAGALATSINLAGGSISGVLPAANLGTFTNGSALFWNAGLAQDNANFFWDLTNHRLGLGTTAPGAPLQISSTASAAMAILSNSNASSFVQFMLRNDQSGVGSAGLELIGSLASPANRMLIYNQVGDIALQSSSGTAALTATAGGNLQAASLVGVSDAIMYATAANGQFSRLGLGSGFTLSSGTLSYAITWPAANQFVYSTGTGPTGSSTITYATGAIMLSGADAAARAIYLTQAATQQIAKANGRFDIGTNDANLLTLMTNNSSRLLISSAGALQFTAYGAGYLATDGSGNVTANAWPTGILSGSGGTLTGTAVPGSGQIAYSNGTGLVGDAGHTWDATNHREIISTSDAAGIALLLSQSATQQLAKSNGRLDVGTTGASIMTLMTNNASRLVLNATGALQLTAYGAGILGSDASGNVTAFATTTNRIPFGSGTGVLTDSANLTFVSNALTLPSSNVSTYAIALTQAATQEIVKSGGRLDVGTIDANMATLMTNNAARVAALSTGEVQIPNLAGGSDALVYAIAASGQLTRVIIGSGLSLSGGTLSSTSTISWPASPQIVYSTGTGPTGTANMTYTSNAFTLGNSNGSTQAIVLNQAATQEIAKTGGRFDVGTADANQFTLMTNNASRLSFTSTGDASFTNKVSLTGADVSTVALALTQAATQEIVKTGGRFDVGTGDANMVTFMVNNSSRVVIDASGNVQLPGVTASSLVATDSAHDLFAPTVDAPLNYAGNHLFVSAPADQNLTWSEAFEISGGLHSSASEYIFPSGNLGVTQTSTGYAAGASAGAALVAQYATSVYPLLYVNSRATTGGKFTCAVWFGQGANVGGGTSSDTESITLFYTTNPSVNTITAVATMSTTNVGSSIGNVGNASVASIPSGAYIGMEIHRTDANTGWVVTNLNFRCQADLW